MLELPQPDSRLNVARQPRSAKLGAAAPMLLGFVRRHTQVLHEQETLHDFGHVHL
jgi:hypothetical protein